MKRFLLFAGILLAGITLSVQASERWIYVLHDQRVDVLHPALKEIVQSIELPNGNAKRIHPTPGGKFVFVTYSGMAEATAIDVETHEVASTVSFPIEPAYIQFSSMGEKAFITSYEDNIVRIYDHRRAQFTYSGSVSVGSAGAPLLINRRATRIYRQGDDGLNYVYLKTGEIIEVVKIRNGVSSIGLSPDYRTFWGINNQNGFVTIIDEARARVSKQIKVSHRQIHPAFTESGVVLLSDDGKSANFYSERNYRLQSSIDLMNDSVQIFVSDDNFLWSRNDKNFEIINVENPEQRFSVAHDDAVDLTYVIVRSGEGFACF